MFIKSKKGLSDFRLNQLQEKIAALLPGVKIRKQNCFFYVNFSQGFEGHQDHSKLMNILGSENNLDLDLDLNLALNYSSLFILPRVGTMSAWQTKSLEIIHQSGLTWVENIEQLKLFELSFELSFEEDKALTPEQLSLILPVLHDQMTESVITDIKKLKSVFSKKQATAYFSLDLSKPSENILESYNQEKGLGLTEIEINYLYQQYQNLGRKATDVELMMFAQINSEHCRHKIFKSKWEINQKKQAHTLFDYIKQTKRTRIDILSFLP